MEDAEGVKGGLEGVSSCFGRYNNMIGSLV